MDYVAWCDWLAETLADYAETQHYRTVHIQMFASHVQTLGKVSNAGDLWGDVIHATADVLETVRPGADVMWLQLRSSELSSLRDSYTRRVRASSFSMDDVTRRLLAATHRLSTPTEPKRSATLSSPTDSSIATRRLGGPSTRPRMSAPRSSRGQPSPMTFSSMRFGRWERAILSITSASTG